MGLGPKKPSISGEKTFKTYNLQNIVLSLAYLKRAQNYPTVGQNHLAWNLLDNKVWKISCNWLNTVLKVKQNGYMGQSGWLSVCWWFTLLITGLARSGCCTASWERIAPRIASPRKIQIQHSKYGFLLNAYHFCTVRKSKTVESHHCKSGTVHSPFLSILSYGYCGRCVSSPVFVVQELRRRWERLVGK